jgi:hypothetical protein
VGWRRGQRKIALASLTSFRTWQSVSDDICDFRCFECMNLLWKLRAFYYFNICR